MIGWGEVVTARVLFLVLVKIRFSIESTGYPKRENRGKVVKTGRIQGISLSGVATSSFNNYLSSDNIFIYYYMLGPRRKKNFALRACPRTNLRPLPYGAVDIDFGL